MLVLFFKAEVPGQGNLFAARVQVKGHAGAGGTYVQPHMATRFKNLSADKAPHGGRTPDIPRPVRGKPYVATVRYGDGGLHEAWHEATEADANQTMADRKKDWAGQGRKYTDALKFAVEHHPHPDDPAPEPRAKPRRAGAPEKPALDRIADKLGKIGQSYHHEIPLKEIFGVLRAEGYHPIQEDGTPWSGMLTGRDGRTSIELRGTKKNLHLQWHVMPSGRWEVNAYVS